MPTGYTAKLNQGEQPFVEFVLECSRAFGALVTMRDDPSDAPIPEQFEPSPYYAESLGRAQTELAEWEASGEEARHALYDAHVREEQRSERERTEQHAAIAARYDAMAERVWAWKPPSREHFGLKGFMLEQLTTAREFDCYKVTPAKVETFDDWCASRGQSLSDALARALKGQREELDRVAKRNLWVKQLRASLKEAL